MTPILLIAICLTVVGVMLLAAHLLTRQRGERVRRRDWIVRGSGW